MSTTITRHPDDANLMSFAAGALPEPLAAAVAAHLQYCRRCRSELRGLRALGGALLADAPEPAPSLTASPWPAPATQAGELAPAQQGAPKSPAAATGLPAIIARHYQLDMASLRWRWLGPGIRHVPLPLSPGVVGDLRLLKIAAGRKMPEHGHGGCEMTLVLDGAYSDETGAFGPGDIQDVDGELEHQPVVDPHLGCICLVASERPARFKGAFSRLLQPWSGM